MDDRERKAARAALKNFLEVKCRRADGEATDEEWNAAWADVVATQIAAWAAVAAGVTARNAEFERRLLELLEVSDE